MIAAGAIGAVGVIVALPAEARCLAGRGVVSGAVIPAGGGIAIYVSGVGAPAARRAAARALADRVRALASVGVAAGLDPALHSGALVVATQVVRADGRVLACDPAWAARVAARAAGAGVVQGGIAEAPDALRDAAAKQRLYARTGALAADMESAAVVAAAHEAGAPALVVRAVSDAAGAGVPQAALAGLAADGAIRPWPVLLALARRPRDTGALLRVALGFRAARGALARLTGGDAGILAPP